MPGHYKDKKNKRKATPFDGLAKKNMEDSFKKRTAPKPPKPKPPKPPKSKPPKPPKTQNRRTGEDFLEMERKRKKKRYNPYGSGSANPSNMSGSTGP